MAVGFPARQYWMAYKTAVADVSNNMTIFKESVSIYCYLTNNTEHKWKIVGRRTIEKPIRVGVTSRMTVRKRCSDLLFSEAR